jgi:DNA primase
MGFPQQILDEIKGRLPVSQIVGRRVALKRQGREFAGLSPFKPEKTPSFFVNDTKGFYHCFASGEHGDIFAFVMKMEGLDFPAAVEKLAAEAGVMLPKPEPRDVEQVNATDRLYQAMEAACRFFEARVWDEEPLAFFEERGLEAEQQTRFRIGYAPSSRSSLREHLAQKGFSVEEMATAGLLIHGEDISVPYDRFRNRVMFPITDPKGRVIAFGGRALDAEQSAKYMNSPETPLFHKGNVLYNLHLARPAAHDAGHIIAVEGYMDVVSMDRAGITAAVAPLGTALTENQLALLWRMHPEPILCFDGDSAGKKAAYRAIDVALPKLAPNATLRFVFLPDKDDPDSMVRDGREGQLKAILQGSRPLVEVLFEREVSMLKTIATPEQQAKLVDNLAAQVKLIANGTLRTLYGRQMREKAWALLGPKGRQAKSRHPPASESLRRKLMEAGF